MASGYESNGTDLDSIFASYVTGHTQAPITGEEVLGADLNTRYDKLSYGSAAPATGTESGGNDLNTIFAKKGTVVQALTLYPTNTNSVTMSTAKELSTSSSFASAFSSYAFVNDDDVRSGWGEIPSQSTNLYWPQLGSEPSPSGKGFLWDVTTLEGLSMPAGTWTPALGFEFVAISSGLTVDVVCRIYKRSDTGVYTLIAACEKSSVVLDYQTLVEVSSGWTGNVTSGSTTFSTGDKLYVDVILDILAGPNATMYTQLNLYGNFASVSMSLATPGYIAA